MIYIIFTNKLFHYLKEKVIIMRKITLLVLLFAVVGNIKAAHYEYIPLVRDGVEWGYSQQLFGKSYYPSFPQLFYPLMTRQFFCDFHEKSEDFCVS